MKCKGKDGYKSTRVTLLTSLIFFVFIVLVAAAILAGFFAFLLYEQGIFEQHPGRWVPMSFIILFGPSVIIGTVLSGILGKWFLRSFRQMVWATREIAAGNFDIQLTLKGPKPRELRILYESFNTMARDLGSIETLRNDFVSNISHEFKTPVTSIKGFAKLLKKEDLPPERRREYLDIIISESERLTHLSGNVLLLSKLEAQSGIGRVEPFSLDEQIRRTILLLEPQCRRKQLELDIELEPVTICANEELLHHVWLNLMSNAVKFTPPDGKITVRLWSGEAGITATIADTGIGMTEQVRERLFDKFYQGDKSRITEGNGLGLSLAQRIVELSGGTITLESEVDKGSCFTVVL